MGAISPGADPVHRIWATDTGALIFGNLIGGPKLAPALSPGKTWAGIFGGIVLGTIAGVGAFVIMQLGAVARRFVCRFALQSSRIRATCLNPGSSGAFGIKNCGGLIPGHGGVLDRIDSTLLAAPVLAAVVLVAGFQSAVRSARHEAHRSQTDVSALPDLRSVLARQRHGAGLDRLHRRQHAGRHRPCAPNLWR